MGRSSNVRRTAGSADPSARRPQAGSARRRRRFPLSSEASRDVVLTYPILDYDAAEMIKNVPAGVEELVSLGDPCHYLMPFSKAYSSGTVEFCGLTDGFFVQIHDVTFSMPHMMLASAPNMLRVRIASEGDGEYASAQGDFLDIKGPSATIVIEPSGQPPAEAVLAGRNVSVQIYIHRDALDRLFALSEQELPAVLQDFLSGELKYTVARRLPLNSSLLRFLDDLQNCPLNGRSRRLVIRSKAIEILCHAFSLLAQVENDGDRPEATVSAANSVLKAQRLLIANFVTPPSLDELAHQVGLSRSSLCAAFRLIVGQPIFDYVADLRMEEALTMLNRPDMTIAEIAYAVGYHHPSSFSVAVQRRFGTTASELRRRGISRG